MIQIRKGVFETNSSSVHTITICPRDDYDKWIKGEVLFGESSKKFYTLEEAVEEIKSYSYYSDRIDNINTTELSEELEELLSDCEFHTTDSYGVDYENYCKEYTTKSGDDIVVFGYVGSDR